MRILILCTGNSCRSQMAEGFLKAFNNEIEVYSAGTDPTERVNPKAIFVMNEMGVDISQYQTELVDKYLDLSFDYVITVCGGAKESCPNFTGTVNHHLHIGFDDPADAVGTEDEVLNEFRRIRNEILVEFFRFYRIS